MPTQMELMKVTAWALDEVVRLREALEPFARGLTMFESGECVTEDAPLPRDDEPAKNVYVGDQRRARAALDRPAHTQRAPR